MKFFKALKIEWILLSMIFYIVHFSGRSYTYRLNSMKKILIANREGNETTINNTRLINEFPIKIDLNWNQSFDNLNLHFKKLESGNVSNKTTSAIYRFANETLNKTQTMMIEKLISGDYILYAEKFNSFQSFNESHPTVNIYSGSKSIFNITCNQESYDNLDWLNPVYWEIGLFTFSRSSAYLKSLNYLTNFVR